MIYVTSDIHGNYEKYIQIFDAINFKEEDTLYVIGDVIDRGKDSIKILEDMMCHVNIIPLIGNHEYLGLSILKKLVVEVTEETLDILDEKLIEMMLVWYENGGESTLEEFKKLEKDYQNDILDYISEFELYQEVSCNGQDYILVHAGLGGFEADRPIHSYFIDELIDTRTDYGRQYFDNKILVTGHTPVQAIKENNGKDKIYKNLNHIAIDCGCGFGQKLAVYCLDDGREFYI